jgi:hypothetical protein
MHGAVESAPIKLDLPPSIPGRLSGRTNRAARRMNHQLTGVRFLDGYRAELIEQRGT